MNIETDATRLTVIRERCELATEGPWVARSPRPRENFYEISTSTGKRITTADFIDSGVALRDDADFITHAREDIPWLLKQLGEADAAWQASESRLVHICQLLSVDYTCEEPETCEQVIERLRGRFAGIRHVVEQQTEFLRTGCDIQPSEARARAKVFISMGRRALAAEAGKPETDVISAAARYEDADRQYQELDPDNPWYGHYKEILLADRMRAKKDLCDAVKRLREGSSGTAVTTEKEGGE